MIEVYKETFKARATSLRARRVAECFQHVVETILLFAMVSKSY
jgi:hypothetical protein